MPGKQEAAVGVTIPGSGGVISTILITTIPIAVGQSRHGTPHSTTKRSLTF